jgi:serine/threonine-protein kinase HipA
MLALTVRLRLPDGNLVDCGRLVFTEPDRQGRYRTEFAYAASWLQSTHRLALDPESLPLSKAPVTGQNLFPPLAVFDDALPDRWGRRLMAEAYRLTLAQQAEPYLLGLTGHGGLGALRFDWDGRPPAFAAVVQPSEAATVPDLGHLLAAAEAFESGRGDVAPGFQRLLRAGQTPGGARPKALLREKGVDFLAKFPSQPLDDGLDIVGLEAACLATAREAGLPVPDHAIVRVGMLKVLLLRRFDVLGAEGTGRAHMLSLRTLCKERPGAEVLSYGELFKAVLRHSSRPREDVALLFRHMVFNAVLGNTDDHLKNFWMLYGSDGWRLAPAIDLLPDTHRRHEHALAFDLHATAPTRSAIEAFGARWGVAQASAIVDEVCASARRFQAIAGDWGVDTPTCDRVLPDIARRLSLLSVPVAT